MRTTFCLALLSLTGPASAESSPPAAAAVRTADAYEELAAEYEGALDAWREKLRAADRGERSAIRKAHPALTYWARFEALADGGEGRALLWLAGHLKDAGVSVKDRAARSLPYFDRLVAEHRESEWFGDALEEIRKRAARLDRAKVLGWLETVATRTERVETKAHGLYLWAKALAASESEDERARADALFESLATEFTGTEWARKAQAELAGRNLQPGRPAPNFEARTIDGHAFQLSDYRGKVVLLDFYGFW